jgi:2-dehydropantoate 2-reductase
MRVAVWGAGAIGGVAGAGMAASGEDVVLVDSVAEHVEVMNAAGLRIRSAGGERIVPVRAALPGAVRGPLDLVFLAVKSQHTEAALGQIAPLLSADAAVVSLQNGLNEPVIAARIGAERTIGAMVDFSADYHGPGLIMQGRVGALYVGELDGRTTTRVERARRLLAGAMPATATDNIMGYVWSKLCKGSMDATTALVDASIAEVRGAKPCQRVLVEVVREGALVAAAEGVRLEPYEHFDPFLCLDVSPSGLVAANAMLDRMSEAATGDLKVRTGYWRDIVVRRRRTEIAHITGEIVRRGRQLGIATPVNQRQLELFEAIEDGRRPMSWQNLEELGRAIAGVTHARD